MCVFRLYDLKHFGTVAIFVVVFLLFIFVFVVFVGFFFFLLVFPQYLCFVLCFVLCCLLFFVFVSFVFIFIYYYYYLFSDLSYLSYDTDFKHILLLTVFTIQPSLDFMSHQTSIGWSLSRGVMV